MRYFILIILLIIKPISENNASLHPVHLSVTTIEFNEDTRDYDLLIKVFTDDFEHAVNKSFNEELLLGKETEHPKCDEMILSYIKKRLSISFTGKDCMKTLKFSRKELKDENVMLLYFKMECSAGRKVSITNLLLTELYDDQKNLLIFTHKNTQEAFQFEKNKTNFEFSMK